MRHAHRPCELGHEVEGLDRQAVDARAGSCDHGVSRFTKPLERGLARTVADAGVLQGKQRGIARYYIGHTSDLPGKRRGLGADVILAVYVTGDSWKAFRLTEYLARAFELDGRSGNGPGDLYGQLARAPYYVYLAVWWRKPARRARKRKAATAPGRPSPASAPCYAASWKPAPPSEPPAPHDDRA